MTDLLVAIGGVIFGWWGCNTFHAASARVDRIITDTIRRPVAEPTSNVDLLA